MKSNDSTGQKTSGPMGPPEKHNIICQECDFREHASDSWGAELIADEHRAVTGHSVEERQER